MRDTNEQTHTQSPHNIFNTLSTFDPLMIEHQPSHIRKHLGSRSTHSISFP